MTDYGKQHLWHAADMLEEVADKIRRMAERAGESDSDVWAGTQAMHDIAWGTANALSSVETCLAHGDRQYQIELLGKKGGAS